jgi:uncharacterized iron-regulated membrane protein
VREIVPWSAVDRLNPDIRARGVDRRQLFAVLSPLKARTGDRRQAPQRSAAADGHDVCLGTLVRGGLEGDVDGEARVTAPPEAARLPLDDLLTRASIAPADIDSLALRADRDQPLTITFLDRARPVLALDPYTAAPVTVPKPGKAAAFFAGVRRWHRYIGTLPGFWRAPATAVTGAADVALVGLAGLGLILWWPSAWTSAKVLTKLVVRPGLRGRARDFNWHQAIGFWSAVPLLLIAGSGVFMVYKSPALWLDRAVGTPAEQAAAKAALDGPPVAPAPKVAAKTRPTMMKPGDASPNTLFAAVERMHPKWQTLTLAMPSPKEPAVQATVAEGNTFRPDQRWTIRLDPVTATPVSVASYESMSVSRQIRSWYRYTHTGEVFGVAGQTVATIASAGVVLMVWTGLALAWRRLLHAVRLRQSAAARQPAIAGQPGRGSARAPSRPVTSG